MRRLALLLLACAAACPPVPKLSPRGGAVADEAPQRVRGVEVRSLTNAWKGYPSWLTRRFTPIWVSFVNRGSQTFDVTLAALSLVDERGQVHPAVAPTLVADDLLGGPQPPWLRFDLMAMQPEEPVTSMPPPIPAPAPLPPTSQPSQPLPGTEQHKHGIFFDLPPYEMFVPGADQRWEPGLPTPDTPWDPTPFAPLTGGRDARDIVGPALTEGRLLPGTHAEGFVYFRANLGAQRLDLTIQAASESGPPLATRIRFSTR